MDTKYGESIDDQGSLPIMALQQLSEGVIDVGGEVLHSEKTAVSPKVPPRHRRCQSEVVTAGLQRSDSYKKLKNHVQKAWRTGSKSREECSHLTFNPEVLANQKRQWYQLNSKTLDCANYNEPASLFEHFVIVGLHPDANLEDVEVAFANRKKWEKEGKYAPVEFQTMQRQKSPVPAVLEPQILFKYPPGKKLTMRMMDLASFCFPGGVKASLLERTPSLSELNELVYGQIHLGRDDLSFIFSLKERLNRITQFVNEMTLTGSFLPPKLDDQTNENDDTLERESFSDWMACAIPVKDAAVLAAAAAGIIPDDEISAKLWDPESPGSMTPSDASDIGQVRDVDKDGNKRHDDCASDVPQTYPNSLERMSGSYEDGHASPIVGTTHSSRSRALKHLGSSQSPFRSPIISMASEDEDDLFANNDDDGDDFLMEWARENKNDLLLIVCRYHDLPLPRRGSEIIFHPLEHLQPILYRRPPVVALGFLENCLNCYEPAKVNAKLAAAEEALALSIWTIVTICRVMSLENLVALIAGVLLEKQVLLECPNLGVLSAVVLCVIPMIRPFQWQSLFLPVSSFYPRECLIFLMHQFRILLAYSISPLI